MMWLAKLLKRLLFFVLMVPVMGAMWIINTFRRFDFVLAFCTLMVGSFVFLTFFKIGVEDDTRQLSILRKELKTYQAKIEAAEARNASMLVEIEDIKTTQHALEEKARTEFKMIKQGEYFVEWDDEHPVENKKK